MNRLTRPPTPSSVVQENTDKFADKLGSIEDGMTALNNDLSVLADVPGYAGAFMLNNHRFGAGSTYKTIPFNEKYGPEKKAYLSNSRLYLNVGSWSAHFTISTSGGGGVGHGLRARVYDTAGTPVISRYFDWQTPNAGWDQHFAMPIIVTEDGWSLELAYRHNGIWWTLYGGTEKTLVWVERKNIETSNHTVITNPSDGWDIE